jgi:photosystem II stability/assembly factor-like uncharacterized protein
LFLFAGATLSIHAQPTLYTCAAFTKEYVVGAALPPSGLFRRSADGQWKRVGFSHPFLFGFAPEPLDPSTLYLAAGNGLIRAAAGGEKWSILTGSDVTELRDVTTVRGAPGTIYFAHTAGIRATNDGGKTWRELGAGLRRKYTEALRVDPERPGVLIAGTEEGIFRSEDAGKTWKLAGAAGFPILRIEPSPHDACFWLAATEQGGLFASSDCGRTFESGGPLGVERNLYDIAFDPGEQNRIAVAGWSVGVAISTDRGKTWQLRNAGLPRPDVTSLVFDSTRRGRLFAAVHEEAVYLSDDAGATWRRDGLAGSQVTRMRFVPEAKVQ